LLLVFNRAKEAMGHIPLGTGLDQGVAVCNRLISNLFQFNNPALEAFKNFGSFFVMFASWPSDRNGISATKTFRDL
jgi:hypothetical protein